MESPSDETFDEEDVLMDAVRKKKKADASDEHTAKKKKQEASDEWTEATKKKKKPKKLTLVVQPTCTSVKLSTVQELLLWSFDLTTTNPRANGVILENRSALTKIFAVVVEVDFSLLICLADSICRDWIHNFMQSIAVNSRVCHRFPWPISSSSLAVGWTSLWCWSYMNQELCHPVHPVAAAHSGQCAKAKR